MFVVSPLSLKQYGFEKSVVLIKGKKKQALFSPVLMMCVSFFFFPKSLEN